jgi:hypothetical protein
MRQILEDAAENTDEATQPNARDSTAFRELLNVLPRDDQTNHDSPGILGNQRSAAEFTGHVGRVLDRSSRGKRTGGHHLAARHWSSSVVII